MFKTIEDCYLQILQQIISTTHCIGKTDNGEFIITSSVCYSRMCHVETETSYVFDGYIPIAEGFTMHYFFSNKRSYISIDNAEMTETDMSKCQLYLLKLCEKFFIHYKIDLFVSEWIKSQ